MHFATSGVPLGTLLVNFSCETSPTRKIVPICEIGEQYLIGLGGWVKKNKQI